MAAMTIRTTGGFGPHTPRCPCWAAQASNDRPRSTRHKLASSIEFGAEYKNSTLRQIHCSINFSFHLNQQRKYLLAPTTPCAKLLYQPSLRKAAQTWTHEHVLSSYQQDYHEY